MIDGACPALGPFCILIARAFCRLASSLVALANTDIQAETGLDFRFYHISLFAGIFDARVPFEFVSDQLLALATLAPASGGSAPSR